MNYRRLDAVQDRLNRLQLPAPEVDFSAYRHRPVAFVREVLGAESATRRSDGSPYQFEVLTDLGAHPRVVVRSGHGVGKSTVDAWAALWWLVTRPMSRVVVVAPEFSRQIRAVLFSEMRKWVRRAKVPLPVEVRAHRIMVQGYGEEWAAIGVPATEPGRIEGFHSDAGVLLILDETKGIGQDVFDALQGALSGLEDNRLLVTSTPGGMQGPFYRICAHGGSAWRHHHLSSEDSSQVSPAWVTERAREWGADSPLYQTRVRGVFADHGEGVLFPLSLLERARTTEHLTPITMGVDVARSLAGDQNCVAICKGGKLDRLVLWRSADTMTTVSRVLQEVIKANPKIIRVDETGVGAGVVDRLRQLRHPVEGIAFGGSATDPSRFLNWRAEAFWHLRDELEAGHVALPDDDDLTADLSALHYEFTSRGQIKLESKDDTRRRLGRSPDRADAVALALGVGTRRSAPWQFFEFLV